METGQLKCSECGAILSIKDAKGVWIECPFCHTRFTIDNDPDIDEIDNSEEFNEIYYFSQLCDYQSFRTQCFDMMMRMSPVDIFSELKLIEEKQCYLPYVSSIGGDSNSYYNAEYVGTDKHVVILQQYAQLSYKNSDTRFGTFLRNHDKGSSSLETIPVDDARVEALPQWAARADALHYYPFYCLVCRYKGTIFTFSSLGDSSIESSNIPVDGDLHRKPHLINLSNSERVSYARKGATISVVIIALCLLLFYWQDITSLVTAEKDYLTEHWEISHSRNGWFAYVLYFFKILWIFIEKATYIFVGGVGTFCISFCLVWLAIVIGVFLHNRYVTHCRLKILKIIQQRKQQDANTRFAIHLDKLYDKEINLH